MNKSIRKVLSAMLVMLLMVGMLPTVFAADVPAAITEVSAPAGTAPQIGQKAAETTHTGDGYTVTTKWSLDGQALAADAAFAPGVYTMTAVAAPAEGRAFAETVDFTLGGETRSLAPRADGTLAFEKTFDLKLPVIDSVVLNLPVAIAGAQVLPYIQSLGGIPYRADGQWQDAGETFEAGKTYTINITVMADDGWTFADDVSVGDVAGHSFEYTGASDKKSLTLSIQVPCFGESADEPAVSPDASRINEVKFTAPETPAAGSNPAPFLSDSEGDHYSVSGKWMLEDAVLDDKSVFESGKTYTLALTVQADEGYVFAESVKVNGEDKALTGSPSSFPLSISYALKEAKVNAVAAIERDGADKLYETLDAAIEDAVSGETIKVLADTSTAWTQGYYMGKSLTFQLNGHTVSFPAGFCIPGGKTVKFVGGTVNMAGVTKGCNDNGSYNFGAAIVINGTGVLELDGTTYNITGTTGDGIYGHPTSTIRVQNGSALNISGSTLNGITKDNGEAYIYVTGGSSLNITGCKAGLTNTWETTVTDSVLNVSGNHGNGSNGSNYYMTNAAVTFNNNESFGMSAGIVRGENSTITANGNKLNGINATGALTLTGCTTTVTGNGCNVNSKWSKPGAITVKNTASIIGGTLTVTGNNGSGIRAWGGKAPLTVKDCAATITGNTAALSGFGGGIMSDSAVTLDDKVVIANNHASEAGDDIYTTASTHIPAAPTALSLDGQAGNCLKKIDNWYTDPADARWNAHDLKNIHVNKETEKDFAQGTALKAAHGLTEKAVYNKAEVKFHKLDSVTEKGLANAVFTLYRDAKCTDKVEAFTSDKDGNFTLSLEAGTYFLKETAAPEGYKGDSTVYEIRVTDSETRVNQILDTTVTPNEVVLESVVDASAKIVDLEPNRDGVYSIENEAVRDVTIRKVWKDNKDSAKNRPAKIEISFRENGKETERFTLTKEDNWELTLVDLPVYDQNGKEIKYTVKELTKLKDYTTSYEDDGLTVVNTLKGKPGVTPKTGDQSNIFLWIGVMALSAAAIGVVAFYLVKKSKKAE